MNYNSENDTIIIRKGLYTYHVRKSDDTILFYITPSKEHQTVQNNVTFEQMFGYKAVDYRMPNYSKQNKQFRNNNRNNFQNNNNRQRSNNTTKKPFNNSKYSKTKQQFNNKPKVIYKTNFHKGTIYYPDSIEGFLAINNKKYPENQPKDVKIIASFANMINFKEITDTKYFIIKHRSNIGYIKVLEGDKLVSYENPLSNININYIIEQLSRHVDIIFAPANDSYIEELLKLGKTVTILYPSRDMKEEYLLYVKSITGNANIYHTLTKYFDLFMDRIDEIKKRGYSNARFLETTRLSELKSITVLPNTEIGIGFDIVASR